MPQVANRDEVDDRVTRLLSQVNDRQRAVLWSYLGFPPDVSRVPLSVIHKLEEETAQQTAGVLATLFLLSQREMSSQFGWHPDSDLAARSAYEWATKRSQQVARTGIAAKIRKIADVSEDIFGKEKPTPADRRGILTKVTPEQQDEWRERIVNVFNEAAARATAVSEVTRANTAGEWDYSRRLGKLHGVTTECFWEHRNPKGAGHPCPICAKLEHQPSVRWPEIIPELPWAWTGPPAHPHCDCNLEWRTISIAHARALGIEAR